MRHATLASLALLLALFAPARAGALPISYQLASVAVDAASSSPGLVLYVDPGVLDTAPFALDDGESRVLDLFAIGTAEFSVDLDDLIPKPISVDVSFAAPVAGGTLGGTSRGKWWVFDGVGKVHWDETLLLEGGGALFELALHDVDFGTPGQATVRGTVLQLASVPEPASGALLALGLLALGRLRRARG